MDQLIVKGPTKLKGRITASGSKNASLPILAACLLTDEPVTIKGLPRLNDITTMLQLLEYMGVSHSNLQWQEKNNEQSTVTLQATGNGHVEALYDLVRKMRASILVLGPLLTRFKRAKVSLPGGCAIGPRPIDMHLKGLEQMGARIRLQAGYVEAETDGLVGANILLPFPSVGATENLMMAATYAKGTTTIRNTECGPEIVDLANFLNMLGAKISGAGTPEIVIQGVSKLSGGTYTVMADRIEAATFLLAGLITKSQITVAGAEHQYMESVIEVMRKMGGEFEIGEKEIVVYPTHKIMGTDFLTSPFPGIPTDLQAQLMALATQAESKTTIVEKIFDNRFMHVPELRRMGAVIDLNGNTAIVNEQRNPLSGAEIMCTDLRASAALVLASCAAHGTSTISRIYHLDRGYENLHIKLQNLGANIQRVTT